MITPVEQGTMNPYLVAVTLIGIAVALFASFGFIVPNLLSAKNDMAVLGGVSLLLAWILAAVFFAIRLIKKALSL